MPPKRVNAGNSRLWKADVAASVDQFNQWFMRFAPAALRSTRVKATREVKAAILATDDLRSIDAATLRANPGALPTLRMCTAPPLAVDRLVRLASASRSLIGSMEKGKLAVRMTAELVDENLDKVCRVLAKLLDRDIFRWLDAGKAPTDRERESASTIVADRLCSAVATDTVRLAHKIQQLSVVSVYLDSRGYRELVDPGRRGYLKTEPGTYTFFVNVPAAMGKSAFLPVDAVVQPIEARMDGLPVLIQAESYSAFAESKRQSGAHRDTMRAMRMTYGDEVPFVLLLGGYFGGDYLGAQAAEGIDWVWQHRVTDLERFGL